MCIVKRVLPLVAHLLLLLLLLFTTGFLKGKFIEKINFRLFLKVKSPPESLWMGKLVRSLCSSFNHRLQIIIERKFPTTKARFTDDQSPMIRWTQTKPKGNLCGCRCSLRHDFREDQNKLVAEINFQSRFNTGFAHNCPNVSPLNSVRPFKGGGNIHNAFLSLLKITLESIYLSIDWSLDQEQPKEMSR